jgi:hypothetical protein
MAPAGGGLVETGTIPGQGEANMSQTQAELVDYPRAGGNRGAAGH